MKIAVIFAAFIAVASAKPVLNTSICASGDTGLKVHPDCSKFYQCNNGYVEEHSCPENLYFNGEACDYKWTIDECVGGTRSPLPEQETPEEPEIPEEPEQPEEPEIPEEPETPEEPEQPETPEEPEVPETPEEPEVPAESEEQTPIEGDCPNKPFFYLAHPSNPQQFVICQNGQQTGVGKCGNGLVFSQAGQACL